MGVEDLSDIIDDATCNRRARRGAGKPKYTVGFQDARKRGVAGKKSSRADLVFVQRMFQGGANYLTRHSGLRHLCFFGLRPETVGCPLTVELCSPLYSRANSIGPMNVVIHKMWLISPLQLHLSSQKWRDLAYSREIDSDTTTPVRDWRELNFHWGREMFECAQKSCSYRVFQPNPDKVQRRLEQKRGYVERFRESYLKLGHLSLNLSYQLPLCK